MPAFVATVENHFFRVILYRSQLAARLKMKDATHFKSGNFIS